ncbi:AarF/UbiB family protein [Parvibaculum sp. MBR-TMA-1.3b-4.2]|jgi:ubiquinone biosynthesis protein
MFRAISNSIRLARAARELGRHDALFPLELRREMPKLLLMLLPLAKIRLPWEEEPEHIEGSVGERLAVALANLGPSYIKLGQFLATRPDVIGADLAADLTSLQDKLPPFPAEEARRIIAEDLGKPVDELYESFSEAIAAASIAQVHHAHTMPEPENPQGGADETPAEIAEPIDASPAAGAEEVVEALDVSAEETAPDQGLDVAVKVLRPNVEARFVDDLDSFFWAAETIERFYKPARRLRPVEVVQTLADSVRLEMDFRLEAAAISEMAQNTANDVGFRVPAVDWERTARRVLTIEWVDGIPASDRDALVDAGHDMKALGRQVIQSFLTHALRDGFFHADMHQGNLFVDADGVLVAVDFGIMGRIGPHERRYLADILMGFLLRDYPRIADVHFEAGYVPRTKSRHAFAQALRSIGEPIWGKSLGELSMSRLLSQLFQVTEQFDMRTRPELILLQKTMVVVEGVARHFDPDHNIWESAEPVVKEWITDQATPEHRLEEAAAGAVQMGRVLANLPDILERAERATRLLADNVDDQGVKVHPGSLKSESRTHPALWLIAGALIALLAVAIF